MAVIRKVKEKIKKVSARKKASKRVAKAKINKNSAPTEQKKEILGFREMVVEQAKFSHPEISRSRRGLAQDLPNKYDQDKLILQVRDPWWIHAYWEVRSATIEKLKNELRDEFYKAKRIIRVYDVSHIIFNGHNAHSSFDIEVHEYNNSWYIDTGGPGRSWCVDLGLLLPGGKFIMILRSNTVTTPLAGPSWITDEEWMIPEDMFARLYGLGFGLGQSSPVGRAWQEKVKHVLSSGVSSVSSPVKKAARKFWMRVDCELIVYGATEPDAKVTVQGKPISLRSDGTFTLRFALPDGKQIIPVKAVSADKVDERTITPIVVRETK